jgi:hypothetical protein
MDRHILFGFTNVDQSADPDYLPMASAMDRWDAISRRCFRKQVYSMYAPIPRPCVSRIH